MAQADPTYDRDQIEANPAWNIAFILSEVLNDNAPIGWSHYVAAARVLLDMYDISPNAPRSAAEATAIYRCRNCTDVVVWSDRSDLSLGCMRCSKRMHLAPRPCAGLVNGSALHSSMED